MQYRRIRELREDSDKTQEYIAKILDEHLTTYRRWETGETEAPAHIIKKLALYYNITADYILEITDEPKKIYIRKR